MVEFKAGRQELACYMESNVPWSDVAEKYGYENGRAARLASFTAWKQLEREETTAPPAPA